MDFSLYKDASITEVNRDGISIRIDFNEGLLTIPFDHELTIGESFELSIEYEIQDLYYESSSIGLVSIIDEIYSFDLGYTKWYPVLNLQRDLEPVDIRMKVPSGYMAVTSGELLEVVQENDAFSIFKFKRHFCRNSESGYSFTVAPYEKAESDCDGIPVNLYGVPVENEILLDEYVSLVTDMCLFYKNLFGPQSLPALSYSTVDDRFTNGRSSKTLIMIPNNQLLTETFTYRDFYLSHETVHQWWPGTVSTKNSVDAWLSEGMADYGAFKFLQSYRNEEAMRDMMADDARILKACMDRGECLGPVVPESPDNLRAEVFYLKGAWLLHTLEQLIGKDVLLEVLHSLVQNNACSSISTQDFITKVEEKAFNTDLSCFWDAWLYGKGLPELEYETFYKLSEDNQKLQVKLVINQKSVYGINEAGEDKYYCLPVDITLKNDSEAVGNTSINISQKIEVFYFEL